MAIQNSINLTTTGLVAADGAGVFSGRTVTGETDFVDVANGDGTAGNPTITIGENFSLTGKDGWNGAILESAAVTVTSDGATITCSIEKNGGGDLVVVFSDGYYDWDTTPADTVTLTAGSDTSPTINYVYFLQSTKTLTASTVSWPATEYAPIATVLCQSAASLQTDGAYKVHAWTDHVTNTKDQGHISDINFWIRQQAATYVSGVAQTYTITTNGGSADNVIITTGAGVVLQLHNHTFPAFSGTPDLYVVNDSVTPYTMVTDMNALLTDSTGASMSGRYFSLVLWGVVSEETGDCKLFVNLPSGSYNNSSGITDDVDGFANYSIPNNFNGTGFLISEWKLQHQSSSGGTWTSINEIDLRGLSPSLTASGGGGFPTEFSDNTFRIFDEGDDTKKIEFQASGITTATTRTLTVQDADGTLALTAETGGGTNQTTYATGDILYASASNTLSKLPAGSNTEVLTLAAGVPSWAAPTVGTVTSVSGTTNRVSSTGGATPVIDIDAAYVGQTSLTTLGTVTTGTWNGTDIAVADGGTGVSTLTGVLTGNGTSAITANAITQYGVLVGGASNAVSSTAVGTATHVLTSNGAGVAPTFQAAAGGGGNWEYVSASTASASSSISFTDLSTDVMYVVVIDSMTTGASSFYMRTSTNNGSSYDSGATDYGYNRQEFSSSSSASAQSGASEMSIWKPRDVSNGIIYLYRPSDTNYTCVNVVATSWANSSYFSASYITAGTRKSSADVDAIQFLGSTGTITTGTFTLYKVTV